MDKETFKDLRQYPVIGIASTEQIRFLRHDPMPYTKFYHVLEEERAAHVRKEILQSLAAFGALFALVWWLV